MSSARQYFDRMGKPQPFNVPIGEDDSALQPAAVNPLDKAPPPSIPVVMQEITPEPDLEEMYSSPKKEEGLHDFGDE